MAAYNPFKKPLGEQLDASDLGDLLNVVAEGFYVEYKSTFVDPKKIARSLASFANTYGGWYFIGVEADKQAGNVATKICGFEITQYTDPLARILDPARQRLSHMPLMFPQLIKISQTHAVVAVYIPEGMETPYITSEGTIYRRAADASDPIGERDRYAVDRLVDRGRKERQDFAEFCQDHREFSQNDNNVPWISMYFRPQPPIDVNSKEFVSSQNIEHFIKKSREPLFIFGDKQKGITASFSFDGGYPSGFSIILQKNHSPQNPFISTVLQIFPDGSGKIHIPIPDIRLPEFNKLDLQNLAVHEFIAQYMQNNLEALETLRFVNPGIAITVSMVITTFYVNWLKEQNSQLSTKLWLRVFVNNVWRIVPVFDSSGWLEFVKKSGLPIVQRQNIAIPELNDSPAIYNYIELQNFGMGLPILPALAFGIPMDKFAEILTDELFRRQTTIPSI